MYVHRIIIDANQINTRGGILAMNSLEALHAVGLVEIYQTSTLPIEFHNWERGRTKASNYTVVGGSNMTFLASGGRPDSSPGTPSKESRFMAIHQMVFGEPNESENRRNHDMRDALHIDQANQNHADFFVTDEKAMLRASPSLRTAGIDTLVCSAEACLQAVQDYFTNAYGTTDIPTLQSTLQMSGPILLGSNSCGGSAFVDHETGETLLAFLCTNHGATIMARIRTPDGRLSLSIDPGKPLQFHDPGLRVHSEVGPSPIQIGDKTCRSFSINTADAKPEPVMAARWLRNDRLLFYQLTMHSASGRLAVRVDRSDLRLSGVTVNAVS